MNHSSLNRPFGQMVELPSNAIVPGTVTAGFRVARKLVAALGTGKWLELEATYSHHGSGTNLARKALEANAEAKYARALETAYVLLEDGRHRVYLRINPERVPPEPEAATVDAPDEVDDG